MKYVATGNDFVLFDGRGGKPTPSEGQMLSLCDRHFGVGADGVLIVDEAEGFAARMRVWNADGSRPEMCGNGLRAVAEHLRSVGNMSGALRILTGAGTRTAKPMGGAWEVDMGTAHFKSPLLPSGPRNESEAHEITGISVMAVDVGNPHAVVFDQWGAASEALALDILRAMKFPEGANVSFAACENGALALRVHERGVGFTLACGTGACAAVAAHVARGRLPAGGWITVTLPGGVLEVRCDANRSVQLRGSATRVFDGSIEV